MQIKRSKYHIVANLICLILLLGIIIYLGINWNNIPDKIPGHYNFMGVVDRWGNKGELIILPIVGWITYLGMTTLEQFPQVWNTGVTVTAENKERVYLILKNMLVTVKLLVVINFVYLTITSALGKNLPIWFLPVFLILMFGSIIFFTIKLFRAK
jgi:uncharacterized membrane protein